MSKERRATTFLLLTTVIWGSTFFSSKMGLEAIGRHAPADGLRLVPFYYFALRMATGALLFAAIFPRSIFRLKGRELVGSLKVALPGFLGIMTQGWGLQEGSATVVAFLTNLTVVFTPMLGILFFKERLTWNLVAGSLIAIAGVYILTNPTGGQFGKPEMLVLAGALLFAWQIQMIAIYTKDQDTEAMTLGLFVHFVWLSIVPLLIFAAGRAMLSPHFLAEVLRPAAEGRWIDRWAVVWTTLYLAFFASVIAMWVFMRFQRDLPATRAAIIYCLEPVFAALLAWLIVHEEMGWRKIVGGAIIVLSNAVCEIFRPRPAAVSEPSPHPVGCSSKSSVLPAAPASERPWRRASSERSRCDPGHSLFPEALPPPTGPADS